MLASYKAKISSAPTPNTICFIKGTMITTAAGTVDVYGSNAQGAFQAISGPTPLQQLYTSQPPQIEDTFGPHYWTVQFPTPSLWTQESATVWSSIVNVPMPSMNTIALARNNVQRTGPGAGNVAVISSATATGKFYPTGVVFRGFPSGMLAGTTNSFLPYLRVEVNNVGGLVDRFLVGLDANSVATVLMDGIPTGNYDLFLRADGALRKKVSVSYVSSVGASGLDFGLKFGDLDGDNYVSAAEVQFVQNAVGTDVRTTGGWMGTDFAAALKPGMADFDKDGFVTNADYALVQNNSGTYGD